MTVIVTFNNNTDNNDDFEVDDDDNLDNNDNQMPLLIIPYTVIINMPIATLTVAIYNEYCHHSYQHHYQ